MKTHSPLVILLLWLIALTISSIILYSCEKCELENHYTIHFTNDSSTVRFTGSLWQGYTQYEVNDHVISNMRASFKSPIKIDVVEGPADFRFIIDSISTESRSWTESVLDPCYDEHTLMYQLLHPQETFNYSLSQSGIYVYARLYDTLNGTVIPMNYYFQSEQYLEQPYDSTECRGYEIMGEGSPYYILREVGTQMGKTVCTWVKHLREE